MNSVKELTQYLQDSGFLKNTQIIEAFANIDRKDFVPQELANQAYLDIPLSIGANQTISQPSTVAFMLELLAPEPGNRILDIGSGSGYTTALLAYIAGVNGQVIGLERKEELINQARENMENYSYLNYSFKQALPASLGLVNEKFDRILVSAAASTFPSELLDQLKSPARLVIPVKNSIQLINKDHNDNVESKEYFGFNFVPLIN
jgi:protein-L-isoaspartate(D-aspartate) O-methyltransferase